VCPPKFAASGDVAHCSVSDCTCRLAVLQDSAALQQDPRVKPHHAISTTLFRGLTVSSCLKPQAIQQYSAALVQDSTLAAARNNRALAYLKTGQHAEAEADASAVLAAEPRNVKALLRRANAR